MTIFDNGPTLFFRWRLLQGKHSQRRVMAHGPCIDFYEYWQPWTAFECMAVPLFDRSGEVTAADNERISKFYPDHLRVWV